MTAEGAGMKASRCVACGDNAGKNPNGTIRHYCTGFVGPLETYTCQCDCHHA